MRSEREEGSDHFGPCRLLWRLWLYSEWDGKPFKGQGLISIISFGLLVAKDKGQSARGGQPAGRLLKQPRILKPDSNKELPECHAKKCSVVLFFGTGKNRNNKKKKFKLTTNLWRIWLFILGVF